MRDKKGQQRFETSAESQKITCQMGHPIGGIVPFSWYDGGSWKYVTNPAGGDGSALVACCVLDDPFSCT
jgi:hypothetical protein